MKRLAIVATPPSYLDRYVEIRDSKMLATRAKLVAIHKEVSDQFAKYSVAITGNSLHKLKPHPTCGGARTALRSCYDIPTIALRRLKADIRSAQPSRGLKYCPMCGTTLPTTHDHYLPAERFPEFSVLALNLVPCCAQCNSIKDDDWLDDAGSRQYIHPFSDELPSTDFLHAKLEEVPGLSGVGVIFSIFRPSGATKKEWALIQSHFTRLRLIERYNELGNDEIAEILSDCRVHIDEGGTSPARFLGARAREARRAYGQNHWRAVLMAEIAAHPNLPKWVP